LPISIEKKFEDSPGFGYIPKGLHLYKGWPEDNNMERPINNCEYKEGVFVGYRWYESKKIEPLYPFGFGLSYTSFGYGNVKFHPAKNTSDKSITVEFELSNTGKVAGAEIAQVYIWDVTASVPRPVKELKGFKKVYLQPGEKTTISLKLAPKDFAFYDVKTKQWVTEPGEYHIIVGSSSAQIQITQKISL
jgi:beta-glucosidase